MVVPIVYVVFFCAIKACGVSCWASGAHRRNYGCPHKHKYEEIRGDTMEDFSIVTEIVEALMTEYAKFVGAPFPMNWEGTAYEDSPELGAKWESEHPAYVAAGKWLVAENARNE